MKRIIFFFTVFLLSIVTLYSNEPGKSLLTFDLNYARIGLSNNGWGIGTCYEQLVLDHFSIKGGFGHMTFKTSVEDLYCTTVNVSLLTIVYPFSQNLHHVYIGFGCSTDFLNYFGSGTIPDKTEDSIIYLNSTIGWKEYFLKWFLIDVTTGYNFIISDAENYPDFKKYGKSGFQTSVGLKILLQNK